MAIFLPPERWIDVSRDMNYYWADLSLDSFRCPADCIGVAFLQLVPTEAVRRNTFGVRKNGSTDTGSRISRASGLVHTGSLIGKLAITGCDSNRIVETYLANDTSPQARIFIVAWFVEADGAFFDNIQLPDDAGWRASFVNNTTWYELDMSSVEPGGGPPAAYIMNRYNGHWSTGNMVFLPWGRESGPEGGLNNAQRYETHGSSVFVPPGVNGNIAFVVYDTNANIEAQCIGYLNAASGFVDTGPMTQRIPTPGNNSVLTETYVTEDLGNYVTMPADAIAASIFAKYGSSGGILAWRENDPRSDIRWSGGYTGIDHFLPLLSDMDDLAKTDGKWIDSILLGVFVKGGEGGGAPIAPSYGDLTHFNGDPVSVNLATGWTNPDPDGYTVDQLPTGLSMSLQGLVTGTPTSNGTTTVTVTNNGLVSLAGAEIQRPEGALFYDDFFQYDTAGGANIAAAYGTWQLSRNTDYAALPLPEVSGINLRRVSTDSVAAAAAYWIPPLNQCITLTLGGTWKNSGSTSCRFIAIMRLQSAANTHYRLTVSPSTADSFDIRLARVINTTFTTVASQPNNTLGFNEGDRIRWESQGNYHRVLYKPSGGAEAILFTATDSGGTGTVPATQRGELLVAWEQGGGTEQYPLADVGVWNYGEFTEYDVAAKVGPVGVASAALPGYPAPLTSAGFDWTIIAKPVPPAYSPLYHRQGGAVNVNLATGWTDANASGFSASNLPDGLNMSSAGVVTGTPTTVQTNSVTVQNGTDAGTVSSAAFDWEIFLGATPPTYPPRNHYANDVIPTIDFRIGWEDDVPNQFFADQLPTGISMGPNGLADGTPTVVEAVSVTIRNGVAPRATYADPFLWSIFAKPVPPAYSPLDNDVNDVVNIDLSVGWTDANPTGFAATGLPQGLTISSAGVVTGTATAPQVASVTVTNDGGAGPVGANGFVWTVADVVTPPNYPDRVGYVGDVIDVDLSEGWILQ